MSWFEVYLWFIFVEVSGNTCCTWGHGYSVFCHCNKRCWGYISCLLSILLITCKHAFELETEFQEQWIVCAFNLASYVTCTSQDYPFHPFSLERLLVLWFVTKPFKAFILPRNGLVSVMEPSIAGPCFHKWLLPVLWRIFDNTQRNSLGVGRLSSVYHREHSLTPTYMLLIYGL